MAMFENFPYTDMHNLNLDWIIKIAKDFLDQYTHIQQLITDGETSLVNLTNEGLESLQTKADNLEELLQAWYDEHSSDIANQLAAALADLNDWYTIHQNYLDNTLATKIAAFNLAADEKAALTIASIPDDYTALSNRVGTLENDLDYYVEKPAIENLFDKDSLSNQTGKYWLNGSLQNDARMGFALIEVDSDGAYSLLGDTLFFGASNVIKIPIFKKSDGSFISVKFGALNQANNIVTFSDMTGITTEPTCYIGYSYRLANAFNSFVVEGTLSELPDIYYYLNPDIIIDTDKTLSNDIKPANAKTVGDRFNEIITRPSIVNLFNKNDPNIEYGKFFLNGTLQSNSQMAFVKIEVPTNGSYSLLGDSLFFASNANKVPIFKKSDGSYISAKIGTLNQNNDIVTFSDMTGMTNEPTCYIGYTFRMGNAGNSFVCEGTLTNLPRLPMQLKNYIEVNPDCKNNLMHKSATFFGDSICAGDTTPVGDRNYSHWGWAGRIGYPNNMVWKNLGVNGASITSMTGRSCIADIVTAEIASNPNTNYIIIEGGTNDADIIASNPNYTLGTFDPYDYTSQYDTTTFCGSLETLFRNILEAIPDKKIGFIIAQKMGVYVSSITNRKTLFDKAEGICKKWGIPYINLWDSCTLNPMLESYYDPNMTTSENNASKYYVDGQHLTDKGYDFISPMIANWMNTL